MQLIKDQKLYEQRIGELEQKCKDMMMMKFGRMIDLEKLEGVTVNRNLEELKEGGGDPNGEPDTMLNLRKTFAGIFGDMRS